MPQSIRSHANPMILVVLLCFSPQVISVNRIACPTEAMAWIVNFGVRDSLAPRMRISKSIAFRLFVLIGAVQAVVLGLLTYAVIRLQETGLTDNVEGSAARLSDMICRATLYSMMLNRKEDVQGIVTGVSGLQGIEGIRIYNKEGSVVFSARREDIGTKVDMNAEACNICHSTDGSTPLQNGDGGLVRIFSRSDGERVLGRITPIRNAALCSSAPCHAHPTEKTVLGVLDVKMSLARVDRQLAASRMGMFILSLIAVLTVSVISWGFIWVEVRRPVHRLMGGMASIAAGNLESRLPAGGRDEFGRLAGSFNKMAEDLSRARKEITAWSATLEEKVREKTIDLENAHREMMKVEKMASLGNLASSVAHELNNPLEGIVTFARLLMKRTKKSPLPPDQAKSMLEDLKLVADEAMRCGEIVKNLLVFARQRGVDYRQVPLAPIIERCVMLMNHHATMNEVRLSSSCSIMESVECDPNQIQQVLIALMVNAVEAMRPPGGCPHGGTLEVKVVPGPLPATVALSVRDDGIGMSQEIKAHIFEPFFTTKSEGKGVGLGLPVAYGIIERHHGSIEFESIAGQGTCFTIILPVHQPSNTKGIFSTIPGQSGTSL
jgi:two-component system NtrC family sensor kinase